MKKFLKFRKQGYALPLAMIVIVLLLIVGGSLLSLGLNARIYSAQCQTDCGPMRRRRRTHKSFV